jgi:hypothetical protein
MELFEHAKDFGSPLLCGCFIRLNGQSFQLYRANAWCGGFDVWRKCVGSLHQRFHGGLFLRKGTGFGDEISETGYCLARRHPFANAAGTRGGSELSYARLCQSWISQDDWFGNQFGFVAQD